MATLFAAQVCGSTGFSMSMAVGAIMAAAITGTNTWSGLPVAIGSLGTALASYPLSRLMARFGRRPGLTVGYSLAVAGAALGMVGVVHQSFAVFLAGMALFGTAQTSNLLARYAAADVSPGAQRGRAMGLIVWGSTVGSIIGPMLMAPAIRIGALVGVSSVASAFLISVAGYAVAAGLLQAFLAPGRAGAVVIAGLFLNGVGWNLAFVSASALLTDALSPHERASIQGLADLVMGLMGAVGSALGGVVLGAWGFGMLNALGAALLIVPLAASWLQRQALAARAAQPDPWAS